MKTGTLGRVLRWELEHSVCREKKIDPKTLPPGEQTTTGRSKRGRGRASKCNSPFLGDGEGRKRGYRLQTGRDEEERYQGGDSGAPQLAKGQGA